MMVNLLCVPNTTAGHWSRRQSAKKWRQPEDMTDLVRQGFHLLPASWRNIIG
jgi:hypothetical protein